jgi:hypothetical protein
MGCELNMCKGAHVRSTLYSTLMFLVRLGNELDGFIERHGIPFDRVIFVGDGTPDYCAAARLRKSDTFISFSNMHAYRIPQARFAPLPEVPRS